MLLVIRFDMDADMVDVPKAVIQNIEAYYEDFYKWLNDPENRHSYPLCRLLIGTLTLVRRTLHDQYKTRRNRDDEI